MASYARPTELTLAVTREHVEGACPDCGESQLARYPVMSELGWVQVVKCQACLHSVSREPWAHLGPVELHVSSL